METVFQVEFWFIKTGGNGKAVGQLLNLNLPESRGETMCFYDRLTYLLSLMVGCCLNKNGCIEMFL